jgi:hypothetical protein
MSRLSRGYVATISNNRIDFLHCRDIDAKQSRNSRVARELHAAVSPLLGDYFLFKEYRPPQHTQGLIGE